MTKKKKWKAVISENVVRKMETLLEKDQKKIMKGIEKIIEDPYTAGKLMDNVQIKAWKNEICNCKKPFYMGLDRNDNEIFFTCIKDNCESFWCTKNELIKGRKKYVKDAQAAGEKLEYKDIEFLE